MVDVMKKMRSDDQAKYYEIFGQEMGDKLCNQAWLTSPSTDLIALGLGPKLEEAGNYPKFQQSQRDVAKNYYTNARAMMQDYGLTSQKAAALLYDSSVQYGNGGARRKWEANASRMSGMTEPQKLQFMAAQYDNTYGGNSRRQQLVNMATFSDGPLPPGA